MTPKVSTETFVRVRSEDLERASEDLIAVSAYIMAIADEYAITGVVAVGALIYASKQVDRTMVRIRRSGGLDTDLPLPF